MSKRSLGQLWRFPWVFYCLGIMLAAGSAYWRFSLLRSTEPFVDYLNFMAWTSGTRQALAAVFASKSGFGDLVYETLAPIYNAPYYVYNISSFLFFLVFPSFGAQAFESANAASVGAAMIAALAWGLAASRYAKRSPALAFVLAVALASVSDYAFHFSVQGWHNFASAAVALLVAAFSSHSRRASWLRWWALALATFSYFIVPWLAYACLVLQDQVTGTVPAPQRGWRRRLLEIGFIVLPGALVLAVLPHQSAEKAQQIELDSTGLQDRFLGWFEHMASVLGWPALIGAVICAGLLARRRFVFPLAFLLLHVGISTASRRFGGEAWMRTVNYSMAVALISLAICAAELKSWRRWLIIGLAIGPFSYRSLRDILDPKEFAAAFPAYVELYEKRPNAAQMIVAQSDARVGAGCILPEDYFLFQLFKVSDPGRSNLLMPREVLAMNTDRGTLAPYVQRHPWPEVCARHPILWITLDTGAHRLGPSDGSWLAWLNPAKKVLSDWRVTPVASLNQARTEPTAKVTWFEID